MTDTLSSKTDKHKVFSRDAMKYIAIIAMFNGHLFMTLYDGKAQADYPLIHWLLLQSSLMAAPIMFFFIVEGFIYTRSRIRYALRLLLFAVISQPAHSLLYSGSFTVENCFDNLNIIFTLFAGILILLTYESKLKPSLKIILIIIIDGLTVLLLSEWLIFGPLMILGLYIFRDNLKLKFIWYLACATLLEIVNFFAYAPSLISAKLAFTQLAFMMISFVLMTFCYSGKKGKHPVFAKWFFYIFYPAHLLLIAAIREIFL